MFLMEDMTHGLLESDSEGFSEMIHQIADIPWMSKEQADRCITGRSGWKKIVSVSDEVKAELAEAVKQDFISTNGQSIPEGTMKSAGLPEWHKGALCRR